MSLRLKLFFKFFSLLLIFTAGLILISFSILMKGFYRLEEQDAFENVGRVKEALINELDRIQKYTGDYALWDDTYAFIKDPDKRYIESNLIPLTFVNSKINLMAYLRPSGEVVLAKYVDLISCEEKSIPPDFLNALARVRQTVPTTDTDNMQGFVRTESEIMLVSARQILTSTGSGPSRGLLISARILDDKMRKEFEKLTRISFEVFPNDGLRTPSALSRGQMTAIRQESPDLLSAFTALADIFGTPSLLLQIQLPRNIYQQGIVSRNYFLLGSLAFLVLFIIVHHQLISQQIARGETEARFSKIVETTPDAVILTTQTGHVVFWNRAAEKMFGYSRKEVIGTPWHLLFVDDTDYHGQNPSDGQQNHGAASDEVCEFTACRKNGSRFPAETSFAQISQNDSQYFCLIMRDISERKSIEENLTRTLSELMRSNAELKQFAYITSHDLQEPLRQVNSFSQLLRDRYGSRLDGKADEYLQFIMEGAGHMSKLIHDLLAYSRLSSDAIAHEPSSCQGALDHSLANLSMQIVESQAIITQDSLPEVLMEQSHLIQLFQNLISNAIKFRCDGIVPQVHIGVQPEGKHWLFRVTDNGIGIDPAYQEKIFLMFQRLHGRGKYPGTGIGLAICKKIVEQHGGEIRVESQEGSGATFFFTLPQNE